MGEAVEFGADAEDLADGGGVDGVVVERLAAGEVFEDFEADEEVGVGLAAGGAGAGVGVAAEDVFF